jgi:hypothetical protein
MQILYCFKEWGEYCQYKDVSESIDVIYQKLARPLQDLENVRYDND